MNGIRNDTKRGRFKGRLESMHVHVVPVTDKSAKINVEWPTPAKSKHRFDSRIHGMDLQLKTEPGMYTVVTHSDVVDQPTKDVAIKLEQAAPEDIFTGCFDPSCSGIQGPNIMDVKHGDGTKEHIWSKSGLKTEGSTYEDDITPWQIYKDGEFIRHIWDVGSHYTDMKTSNVGHGVDSGSAVEQPMNIERSVEQSMGKTSVNYGVTSSSVIEQPVKPMIHVEATAPEHDQHTRTHTKEKPFICSVCEYSCTWKSYLIVHMRTHTGEKLFKCTLCEHRCSERSKLTRHMRTHNGEKPFKCTECKHRSVTKSDLIRHTRTHTGEKPFKCTVCKYRCSEQIRLTRHMRTHTGEKPFKCTMCEYRCSEQGRLAKHMRTHTGEKTFECTLCERKFASKSDMRRHTRTHTGEKPYECTLCEHRCVSKSDLTRHTRTHTGEKPFKCTMCEYRCSEQGRLAKHMRTHTGEKNI